MSVPFAEPFDPLSVSLFTREWIEIKMLTIIRSIWKSLPLYEGVD